MSLHKRIQQVEARVAEACRRSGRERDEVHMIAVTKYVTPEATQQVMREGFIHIGENRWQDAQAKWEAFGTQGVWHFIGHLQTNKVKDVIGKFTYIHSLDRLSLAKELEKKAASAQREVYCFIQINVSGEETKFGLAPDQLISFAEQIKHFQHLRIIGLMTMAPHETEAEATRPIFRGLRQLRDLLNERKVLPYTVPHLSMGMSNDFEIAIEEGATWIRLGTVLVGK